jgi:signal-transduction protein with cAMP-binding, CBS, and nucleotidyltransferase domain
MSGDRARSRALAVLRIMRLPGSLGNGSDHPQKMYAGRVQPPWIKQDIPLRFGATPLAIRSRAMKPVSELLKRRDGTLWHVRPEESVFSALELLSRYEVGALMVMEGGALVGVFSERDYTRKIALQGRNSKETTVADIMTRQVFTVSPSTGTRACMALMSEKRIRHLPVLDGATVLGMISIRDIMDDIIQDHEATIAQLESYIQS